MAGRQKGKIVPLATPSRVNYFQEPSVPQIVPSPGADLVQKYDRSSNFQSTLSRTEKLCLLKLDCGGDTIDRGEQS
jgi:hypothetical protein